MIYLVQIPQEVLSLLFESVFDCSSSLVAREATDCGGWSLVLLLAQGIDFSKNVFDGAHIMWWFGNAIDSLLFSNVFRKNHLHMTIGAVRGLLVKPSPPPRPAVFD